MERTVAKELRETLHPFLDNWHAPGQDSGARARSELVATNAQKAAFCTLELTILTYSPRTYSSSIGPLITKLTH